MSKTAAVVLAFLSFMLFATTSRAQLLPSGNVYVGAAYGDSVDVVNRYTFRGWNASLEDFPFSRFPILEWYWMAAAFTGSECSSTTSFWDPGFLLITESGDRSCTCMGGAQRMTSDGTSHYPIAEDAGGGVDRKFQFLFMKHFSWRLQFDYMRTHLLSATQNDIRGSAGLVWRF